MRKLKYFLFTIMLSFITICSGCIFNYNQRCNFKYNQPTTIFYYGDFVYTLAYNSGASATNNKGNYVVILELTEEGKQKETIIIPEEIDGKPVIQIGMSGIGFSYRLTGGSPKPKFTKLYLPSTLQYTVYEYAKGKIFSVAMPNDELFNTGNRGIIYVSENVYEGIKEKGKSDFFIVANTEFIIDDETYWIDDYNDESLIIEPESPVKDGYEFAGWYKEPECENIWDFETDKVKGKTQDEDGNQNINLTRLYAKWQKI